VAGYTKLKGEEAMAKKPSKENKARLAMWMVVIEFCLSAIRDELNMDKLMNEDINLVLVRLDLGMAALRQHLEMEDKV